MKRNGLAQVLRLGTLSTVLMACAAAGIWVAEQLLFRHVNWIG
jgi:hypothetical protein